MGIDLPNVSCHRWQQYRQSPSEKGHRDSSTALLQAQGMFFFSCLVWCCCLCCLVAQKGKENYRKLGSFVSMLLLFPFFFLLWVVLVYDNTKNVTELSGIGVFSFWGLKEWGFWGWRLWLFPTFSWQPNGAAWLGSQKWKTCYSELWLFSGTFSATKLGISVKIWQNWIKVLYLLILSENYMESKPQINSLVHSYSW